MVALLALTGWPGAPAPAAAMPLPAQEASPAGDCEVPAAATPPAAEPIPSPATPPPATPTDREGATPIIRPLPTATPATDAVLTTELTAVARALAACLSAGRAELVATLATEHYLGQLYGGGLTLPREDYLALAPDLDPVPTFIRSLRGARREVAGFASAEVVSVVGRQLLRSRWHFVLAPQSEREPDRTAWRVDAEEPLPFDPPADAERIGVVIEDFAFTLTETEVAGSTVVLAGSNAGAEDHELLVLHFADGLTAADLLRQPGPGLPDGITYVGQVTVPIATAAELVLVDLEPGDYTIVCLFPTPRGTPHLALGMQATFTVT